MKKIAIIGAGPAGMAAACELGRNGYEVELFEGNREPLAHVTDKEVLFPNFVPSTEIKDAFLDRLRHSGVSLRCGTYVSGVEYHSDADGSGCWRVGPVEADAVLLASGYAVFDARKKEELGYGIYKGVVDSLAMEGMLKSRSVVNGIGEFPRRVVFLQCVGSRDEKTGNNYCSKMCCMTAVKQAVRTRQILQDAEVYVFYMDLRMWGQHFEELYRESQERYGVRFVRGRVSEVCGTFDGKVQLKAEDTLLGRPMKMTTDLLVLMVGMRPSEGTLQLGRSCGIGGEYGFVSVRDAVMHDNETHRDGLFVAGSCKRPMSLSEAVNDGKSAVYEIMNYLKG